MPIHSHIISSDDHDADEQSDGSSFAAAQTDLSLGVVFGKEHVGLFFDYPATGWLIPPGAAIIYAWLQLYADGSSGDRNPTCYVYAEDVDDAVDFASDADVKDRYDSGKTTAFVDWDTPDQDDEAYTPDPVSDPSLGCPDLKTVIQELVDRPGWAKGNALCLLMYQHGGGGAVFDFRAGGHASASTTGPKLTIAWAQNALRAFGKVVS